MTNKLKWILLLSAGAITALIYKGNTTIMAEDDIDEGTPKAGYIIGDPNNATSPAENCVEDPGPNVLYTPSDLNKDIVMDFNNPPTIEIPLDVKPDSDEECVPYKLELSKIEAQGVSEDELLEDCSEGTLDNTSFNGGPATIYMSGYITENLEHIDNYISMRELLNMSMINKMKQSHQYKKNNYDIIGVPFKN